MKRKGKTGFYGKTIAVLILCMCIPLLATWFTVQYLNRNIFYAQKGDYLISIARMLNTQMDEGGYDEILRETGAENGTREEQIAILNEVLRGATDAVASVGDGLGVGFYSRELDAILTYGPSAEFQDNVGKSIAPDHPGREVMATGAPMVEMGTMVRGNIMNAMIPIERGGEVIGYIWANELISDLEDMLNQSIGIISILLLITFLVMSGIVLIFFRRLIRTEEKARNSVEEASREIQRVDGLMHIVNKAVSSLLSADESGFEEALQNSMEMMASAFEVDRLYIWKRDDVDGTAHFHLAARFQGEVGRSHRYIDFEVVENLPPAANWEDWVGRMEENQSVTLSRSAAQQEGNEWFDSFGIQSITTIPVMLQEKFWGFVSFCNCHKEREFTKDEEAILFSGSLLMANAIARNEMLQRLMHAREEALAGTRAKSAFLASMSHEMRTPMNAIIGMATIGKSAEEAERKDYAFGRIEDASTHLLGIINDVLDISKIESGKLESSPVEFVFEEMLQRVINVTDGRFVEKEQSFLVRIEDQVPTTLVCDDQRLAQVITNLLSNAIKFTPHGGSIRLDIRLLAEEDDICTLQFDVIDTGIGLSLEQQARVFHSFEQAESSTTRKYGGTGLGLTISKNLVELMGGEIWVQSEEGKGATFSFTIRAPRGCNQCDQPLPAGTDWGRLRFLLVEDADMVRAYFAHIMNRLGLHCDTASSGEAALALLRENERYDLCFAEWKLPDTEGIAFTCAVKALEDAPKVALLCSALEGGDLLKDAKQAGVDTFLPKPFLPSTIVACIIQCITGEALPHRGRAGGEQDEDYTGRRILLAEDIDINGEILISLLEHTGIAIEWAKNGKSAVQMFRDAGGHYDMVFMDVQMPEMDGYEATRAIRMMDGIATAKTVPIVAMTANVFKEDIEASGEAGMDDHLGKPLNIEEIFEKLRKYLQ